MNLPHSQNCRRRREAFTLVELLIVIGIILVLMSLLLAGVMKATVLGKRTSNANDIQQLNAAVINFMQQYNVNYLPSLLELEESPANYYTQNSSGQWVPKNLLAQDSLAFLKRMFPKTDFSATGGNWIDWNGNNQKDPGIILQGDQCLVFFLGGIPSGCGANITTGVDDVRTGAPATLGFSTNPTNPAWNVTNGGLANGPYYEFKPSRLFDLTSNQQGFFSYLDAYGHAPYAYFSNYGTLNGYNRYYSLTQGSDCTNLRVYPYAESTLPSGTAGAVSGLPYRYVKPNAFQIISAGTDYAFGPGTNPNPPMGVPTYFWNDSQGFNVNGNPTPVPDPGGNDDQANFSGPLLGEVGT